MIFDTVVSNPTGSYNNATGVYTAPETGYYYFNTCISFFGGDLNTTNYLIYWNGSRYSTIGWEIYPTAFNFGFNNPNTYSLDTFIHMTAGDTMQIGVKANGTSKNVEMLGDNINRGPGYYAEVCQFQGFKVA
jgi:C1q domain